MMWSGLLESITRPYRTSVRSGGQPLVGRLVPCSPEAKGEAHKRRLMMRSARSLCLWRDLQFLLHEKHIATYPILNILYRYKTLLIVKGFSSFCCI